MNKEIINSNQYGRSLLLKCAGYTQYFLSDVYTNSTQTKKAQVETVQSGRSMIEMLGVLAIVGVLSVGGIAGYSKAMEKFKINQFLAGITEIVTNIKTLAPDGISLSTYSNLVGSNVLPTPQGWKDYTRTPFDSYYYVDNSSIPIYFFIYLTKQECLALATHNWGTTSSSGFVGLRIESNAGSSDWNKDWNNCSDKGGTPYGGGYICSPYSPMSVSDAAKYCDCQGSHCNVEMFFK